MAEKTKTNRPAARSANRSGGNGAGPANEPADAAYGCVSPGPVIVPPEIAIDAASGIRLYEDEGMKIGPWPEGSPPPPLDEKLAAGWTKEQLLDVYRHMRMAREIENRVINLYRQGKIKGGVYVGRGNEATAVAGLYCLEPTDPVTILHRDLGAHLVRGWTPRDVFMQHFARRDAPNFGKDTGLHLGSLKNYSLGTVSPLGCMIPVTLGCAMGLQMQGKNAVGLTYTGDGATSLGDFHEALNFAGARKAPFVLIVENNQFAYSTPNLREFASATIADRAEGYGMPGITVDGTNILRMLSVVKTAVDRARRGEGPTLIESVTMRMRGHAEHDDASYVPDGLAEQWETWDPIKRYEEFLFRRKLLTESTLETMLADILAAIEDGVTYAEAQPDPSGPEAAEGVYA